MDVIDVEDIKEEAVPVAVTRASIAALDLPIEYAGNIQSILKSQSTPNNVPANTTNKNNQAQKLQEADYNSNDDLPPKGVLHRAHSLDSGKEKIVSVPTIEEIKLISNEWIMQRTHHEIKEEVVVPARNVLIKMPFYTTPQTIEATNNAFRDFMVRLNEMGFVQEAETALVATHAESVEAAVEFIMNNPSGLFHRFASKLAGTNDNEEKDEHGEQLLSIATDAECSLCIKCGLAKHEHIIDEKGDKIDGELKGEFVYGDLNGRVSMSMNTKQQREQQKSTLKDMIEQRVKSMAIVEEEEKEKETAKEEEEVKDKASGERETCSICFVDRELDMFYRSVCGHNYCKICLQTHYKIKTKDGDVLKLSCIDPKCKRLIEEDEILNFLIDEDVRLKFIKFRQNKLLQLNPNARFCCKPDCEGTMIGSRINRKLTCPICATAICFNCSQPWHGIFVGCNQNIDIGYTKWALNKDVQKCPKCRMGIEKEDGCNHMTCTSCKYEFCWICKGPYNDIHFEWWNIFGCPGAQYTPRFCRCPYCFPRWLNRILIILCFLAVVLPIVIVAGLFWFIIVCLIFCIRCDFKCDIDPCDCF
eukprot:88790_1